ncbi:methyltransferase-like protein 27 isoform X2 [Branchiostoma lanceolatum]|uniref:methyltransferase-like protein 27 isoform X2 n=1 Tax=Branchiostoma lanceolatum TaxID=7740 RepID=UPI00345604FF
MDRSMPNENANNPFDKAASVPVDYAGSQAVYSTWAAKYEEDMADMGYNGPRQIVALMHQVLGGVNPSSVRVLDVPAGTGMVGSELQKLGYTNADGLDANPDMLKVAENKHVYQRLIEAKLGTGQLPVAPSKCQRWIRTTLFYWLVPSLRMGHIFPVNVWTIWFRSQNQMDTLS